MKFLNLTSIPNKFISRMGRELKLKWIYPVVILEKPKLKALGLVRYDETNQICLVILKDGSDRSSLVHELRHLWQMEQMTPEVCRVIYEIEQQAVGYEENTLELDAFDWEKRWRE